MLCAHCHYVMVVNRLLFFYESPCCFYLCIKSNTNYPEGLGMITGSLTLAISYVIRDKPGTMTNDFSNAPDA